MNTDKTQKSGSDGSGQSAFFGDRQHFHFIEEGLVVDLQQYGRLAAVPVGAVQGVKDGGSFRLPLGIGDLQEHGSDGFTRAVGMPISPIGAVGFMDMDGGRFDG